MDKARWARTIIFAIFGAMFGALYYIGVVEPDMTIPIPKTSCDPPSSAAPDYVVREYLDRCGYQRIPRAYFR